MKKLEEYLYSCMFVGVWVTVSVWVYVFVFVCLPVCQSQNPESFHHFTEVLGKHVADDLFPDSRSQLIHCKSKVRQKHSKNIYW